MLRIAIPIFFLAIAGCTTSAQESTIKTVEKEILAATDSWRAAYDSRDPVRITATYGKGAVFWGTTMKSVATTPEAIADYFKDAASRPSARVVFTEQHVRVFGGVAFNSGAYTINDIRDGKEITNPSRFSMIFHREGGAWLLMHHHSSRVP